MVGIYVLKTNNQLITAPTRNWRFSAPQTVLWLKKVQFSASTFLLKIANYYKTKACKTCTLRVQCTTNKMGRIIERTEYQQYITENNDRVNQNPEYYRERQQIIEHQFGTLKRHWHFDYVLTTGKENVMGEVYLAFTTYNLRRLASIFEFKTLMSKMKAHFGNFLTVLSSLFNKIEAFVSQLQKRWVLKPLFSKNELLFM